LKKLIHICGTGRSGSTVMDLIIGSIDNSISLGEINAYYYPYRNHHLQAICSCGDKNCMRLEEVKKFSRENVHFKLLEHDSIANLVDSSKSLLWIYENINILKFKNIDIYNIVLIKNFKSYAHSIWKRGGSIDLAYKKYLNYYKNLIDSGIKYCLINQSDLIFQKHDVSKKVSDFIGLSLKEEYFNFWNFEHHYFFGSPSAKNQISNKSIQDNSNFDAKFQNDFMFFLNPDKKAVLNHLEKKLKDRENTNIQPTFRFKIWLIFKKNKSLLISFLLKLKKNFYVT